MIAVDLTAEQLNYLEAEAKKLNEFHSTDVFTPADVLKLFVIMDKRQHDAGGPTITDITIKGNTGDIQA